MLRGCHLKAECDHRISQAQPEDKDAVQTFLPNLTSSQLGKPS